ncbi:MAG: DUF2283 domain-containing protein [Candidatus Anammoxibacter sp.]
MKDIYLEITFRKGKPFVAYLYLTGKNEIQSSKSIKIEEGLIADYDQNGVLSGLEIISPSTTSIQQIMNVMKKIHAGPISEKELLPLNAA